MTSSASFRAQGDRDPGESPVFHECGPDAAASDTRCRAPGRGTRGQCRTRRPCTRPRRPHPRRTCRHDSDDGRSTRAYQQGGYGPEGVLATESQFQNPRGLSFAPNGDAYLTDALNHRVRRIDQAGVVHLVAGTGIPGSGGDGGEARFAQLNEPHGVVVDSEGNVKLNQPVMSLVPTRDGLGYWLVASDGGIFSFSDKPFAGSLGANPPARPIVFAATLDS